MGVGGKQKFQYKYQKSDIKIVGLTPYLQVRFKGCTIRP